LPSDLVVTAALAGVASLAMVLATMAYHESRRTRLLLEAALSAGRAREIMRIRRELSRRPRRRYIVFQVIANTDISERMLHQSLMRTVRRLLGSAFVADSGLQLVYYNPVTRKGVIRVRHVYKDAVLGTLGLTRKIGEASAIVVPILTVGTVKRAKKIADTP